MYEKRVVVTGLGVVTPLGNDVCAFWQRLLEGRSGVAPVTAFPVDGCRPFYAAEVKDFAPERSGVARKKLKMMGRQAQMASVAAHEACQDAGLLEESRAAISTRFGIVLGVGMLNADVTELGRAFRATAGPAETPTEDFNPVAFGRTGASEFFPLWLLRHIPNLATAHASIALDAQGPSNTITTGCVAAANAIGEAARIVARGDADVMLAGGTDARVSPLAQLRYRELGWLSTRMDLPPEAVSAPFDEEASGFVNGEGAGVLALESLDHARRRGARIYAELSGYGAANDAFDALRPHPDGRGLASATRRCLRQSDLDAESVDALFSPANAVPPIDRAVASALTSVWPAGAGRPAVTATRSVAGHTHAASAALDCVAAVKAIADSRIPPTINLRRPIADLDFVAPDPRSGEVAAAVVAAYGFGGHAAALAFRRHTA